LPRALRRKIRFDSPHDHTGRGKLTDLLATAPVRLLDAYQVVNSLLRRDFIDEVLDDAPGSRPLCGLPRERVDLTPPGEDAEGISRVCLQLFLGERCLRDADQTSMASSLEVRAPFTDHVFLERALAVPAKIRAAGPPRKPFESALFADRVPASIRNRRKQGFTMPLGKWLKHGMLDVVRDALLDRARVRSVGLASAPIERLLHDFERGYPGAPWSRVWALTVLIDWCTRHRVARGG
jgi:asparagine synthase (glutamine-hydrolysing)